MPKRRTQNFKHLQGSSSASGNSPAHSGVHDSGKHASASSNPLLSVNQQLAELRKQEGSDALLKKREFAEASSSHVSVPPALQDLLGIPQTRPPRQPQHVLAPRARRVPGPAAPESWMRRATLGASLSIRPRRIPSKTASRIRPDELQRFARMTGVEAREPSKQNGAPSLLHLSLQSAAKVWEDYEQEDLPALVELPLRLRIRLLSYIAFYGPPVNIVEFDALTQSTPDDPITFLDLGGLIGQENLTFQRLSKLVKQPRGVATYPPPAQEEHQQQQHLNDAIAESWDTADAAPPNLPTTPLHFFPSSSSSVGGLSRFSALTHLCLSHPAPASISWPAFLKFSRHVPKLTHLSLAYWPRPTSTPNLATATIASSSSSSAAGPEIAAGGSHYYSALDRNYDEPKVLLRQLSRNLLCLRWLDLEGCAAWLPALAVDNDAWQPQHMSPVRVGQVEDGWGSTTSAVAPQSFPKLSTVGIIFIEHWKNLEYLRCAQSRWLPSVRGVDALPKQTIKRSEKRVVDAFLALKRQEELDAWATSSASSSSSPVIFSADDSDDDKLRVQRTEIERRKAEIWVLEETHCIAAGTAINAHRRAHACRPVVVDHGWVQRMGHHPERI